MLKKYDKMLNIGIGIKNVRLALLGENILLILII